MSLAILFHFLCAEHVSDINISIIRSLRLFCRITTLVVLFLVRCVLEFQCGWVGVVSVLSILVVLFLVRCVLEFRCGWVGVVSVLVMLFLVRCVLLFRCGWVGVCVGHVVLRLMCVGFSVWLGWNGARVVRAAGFSLQNRHNPNPTTPKHQHTSSQEQHDQCGNSSE